MRISESKIRQIIKEELSLETNRRAVAASAAWASWSLRTMGGRSLNEGQKGGELELRDISGAAVARMLRDSGETLLASLIMNHDRPGASEFIWDQILKQGRESSRTWSIDFPLDKVVYEGMSLKDMGFRNGKVVVAVGLAFGQPPIYDFSERISGVVKIDVDFVVDDRYGKRIKFGELRQGGLRSSGKMSPPHGGLGDAKHSHLALQDVDLDYLEHLIARREAFSYI